jgi:endo-1,3-1,4-beta-glycanase ExoK
MKHFFEKGFYYLLISLYAFSAQAEKKVQFQEDFNQNNLAKNWIVANAWKDSSPSGCSWDVNQVWRSMMGTHAVLNVGIKENSAKCGELKSARGFQYGTLMVSMTPLNVLGTVSSFFLYSGSKRGASDHSEIDMEFVGGTKVLRTNYWVNGQEHSQDIDLGRYAINPYSGFRRYGMEWRPDSIKWFTYSDTGQFILLRVAYAVLNTPMPIFLSAWKGDNTTAAILFPGLYNGGEGVAQYNFISIEN